MVFVLKAATIGPFYECNAITRVDLPHGAVLGAPCSERKLFFGLHQYLARRCCANLQSSMSPTQCKYGPGKNMVIRRNQLLYHVSTAIHLHNSPVFTRQYTFEIQINQRKSALSNIMNLN